MNAPTYTLRPARPEDAATLELLARLDSSPALAGPVLLAEADGNVVAAVELIGGRSVADPFEHTADALRLLRARADQLRPRRDRPPRRRALRLRAA